MADTDLGPEELASLAELADDILGGQLDLSTAGLEQPFDERLWLSLVDAGLTRLDVAEALGGGGAGLAAAAVVVGAAAAHAAPIPLAENDLLAGWLLGLAGLPVPSSPLTVASGETATGSGGLTGTLARVPWARAAAQIVLLTPDGDGAVVHLVPLASCEIVEGANLAREPRDRVLLAGVRPAASGRVGVEALAAFRLRGALARAIQLAAAAECAVDLTVGYVGQREQFGRPLSRLQAVQQQLAGAAAEAASARAAVDAAVRIVQSDGVFSDRGSFAVAVAKARAGAAAVTVASTAHQLHGAIGFTLEHQLRLFTTRLWAWSGEFGDAAEWNTVVGQRAAKAGSGLWRQLTDWS